jgi:hypothetical protein
VAGPSRSRTNPKRKATAHVSVDSEDDFVEEIKLGKSNKLKGATVTAKRRRKEAEEEDVEDVETDGEERMRRSRQNELEVDEGESEGEGEGEVQEIVPPTKSKKPRGVSGKPTARSGPGKEVFTNGNTKDPPAVKWKGRAKQPSMVKRMDNTMVEDEMEVVEIEREDVHAEVDTLVKAVHAASREKRALRLGNDEVARLREQLQRVRVSFSQLLFCVKCYLQT